MVNPGPELFLGAGLARWMDEVDRKLAAVSASASGPIVATTIRMVDGDGNPRQVIGAQPDGTYGTRDMSGPTPPTPEAPTAFPMPGGFRVVTTGKPAGVEFWPADVDRIDIHISQNADFAPDEGTRAGSVGVLPTGFGRQSDEGQWYVRLVAVSTSGRPSAATLAIGVVALSQSGFDQLARDAAAAAQDRADEAAEDAARAQQTADQAQAGVGGSTITYSPFVPSGIGKAAGDTWFRRAATGGNIIGQWEWSGSVWVARRVDSLLIANIDAGKITTGVLSAGTKIVSGDPTGARTENSGQGFFSYLPDGVTTDVSFPVGGTKTISADLVASTLSSLDYVESVSGIRLDKGGRAEFGNVSVAQSLSASDIGASRINLAGRDLAGLLDQPSGRLVSQGVRPDIYLPGKVVECGIAELSMRVEPGRGYIIFINGGELGASAEGCEIGFRLRYTLDGSVPTPSSAELRPLGNFPAPTYPGRFTQITPQLWYPPATVPATARLWLTFSAARGPTNATVGIDTRDYRRMQMFCTDAGAQVANSLVANHYEASGSTAPTPPPPARAPQSGSETFYSTWTASYRENGSRRALNNEGYIWQGYADGFNGNQRGLVGFDLGYMRGKLAGANIKSATFYGRAARTWDFSGGSAFIGSHGQDGPPATFPFGGTTQERRATAGVPASNGLWFGQECAGIVREIAASQASGFTIGAAPNNNSSNYAYFFGAPHQDRPRVEVTWER